jgi:hypothetical protein
VIYFLAKGEPVPDVYDTPSGESSDVEIRKAIRKRDGNKCRDCGMTSEESRKKYDKDLDVHRLVPGCAYNHILCVTLCRACHAKKVKNTLSALFSADLRVFMFNMYDPEDRQMYDAIRRTAARRAVTHETVLVEALGHIAEEWLKHDALDHTVTNDGLW